MDIRRYAYVQTRLQARHGERPDATTWARLESIRDPARFLDVARTTALKPWVLPLTADMDAHRIERFLRERLCDYIATIARWHPRPWQPAFLWMSRLADLPAIQHLASGGPIPDWMHEDEALRACAISGVEGRARAFAASDCAPLARALRDDIPLLRAWGLRWQQLWPDAPRRQIEGVRRLATTIEMAIPLSANSHAEPLEIMWERLSRKLENAFRRDTFQPATGLIHIALVALDLMRLRALLLPRLLFQPAGEVNA